MPSDWVSPRVNSTEPWTRGSTPTSMVIGRMVLVSRPSARRPRRIESRSACLQISPQISPTSFSWAFCCSGVLPAGAGMPFTAASLAALVAALRAALLPGDTGAACRASPNFARISLRRASWEGGGSNAAFGLPAFATRSSIRAAIRAAVFWPSARASSMTSSVTCFAPASTITIASWWPATVRLSWFSAPCSTDQVGLSTSLPSTRPMRHMPSVWPLGIELSARAAKLAIAASTSGSFSRSEDSTCDITWTSLRKPSGNIGRIDRSMMRQARISLVVGRPSRLKKPPGMKPPAAVFSR